MGNRAVRMGDWQLVALHKGPWELYNLAKDRTELYNLANTRANVVQDLEAQWNLRAERCDVRPWPVKK